jgi:hypothetical protein
LHDVVVVQENLVVGETVENGEEGRVGQQGLSDIGGGFVIYGVGDRVVLLELMEKTLSNHPQYFKQFIDGFPLLYLHILERAFL